MRGLFVTGTDTGVGKTHVAAALTAAFAARGLKVAGLKPVASGCVATPDGLRSEDALALRAASSLALPYGLSNPYAFAPAIAPHLAAAAAGVVIDRAGLVATLHSIASQADRVVVEGVGGFEVPLGAASGPAWTSGDLAQDLGLPVVLVVGLRLGCLNHALLTAAAIRARSLALAAWVGVPIDRGFAEPEANLATLRSLLAPTPGVVLSADCEHAPERARAQLSGLAAAC